MKKNKKNFAKQKILQASDISDVDFEIPDRRETNSRLVDMLQAPASPVLVTVAADNRGGISTQNFRWKSIFFIFAIFCVMLCATIFILFSDRIIADPTGGSLYSSVVTENEIKTVAPNIALPSPPDYNVTNILLFRYEDNPSPVFVEISMVNSVSVIENKIILTVCLIKNFVFPSFGFFADLKETSEIRGIDVMYNVSCEDERAFAKFILEPYEYYLQYNSHSPSDILDIINTII